MRFREELRDKVNQALAAYRFHGTFRSDDCELLRDVHRLAQAECAAESAFVEHAVLQLESGTPLDEQKTEFLIGALLNILKGIGRRWTTATVVGVLGLIASVLIPVVQVVSPLGGTADAGQSESAAPGDTKAPEDPKGDAGDDARGEGSGRWTSKSLVFSVQLFVVGFFYLLNERRYREAQRFQNATVPRRIVEQFSYYTRWVWGAWSALYVTLLLLELWGDPTPTTPGTLSYGLKITAELFNNVASWGFLMCFAVLDQPSVEFEEGDNRDRDFRSTRAGGIVLIAVCTGCFAAGLSLAPTETGLARLGYLYTSKLPTGLFAGIAMAYFAGRLDSKHLDLSRVSIGVLYGYAVIQLSWSGLGEDSLPAATESAIFLLSLLGKLVLWQLLEQLHLHDAVLLRRYARKTAGHIAETGAQKRAWQVKRFT